jgi:Flp pilus assembly protein CpaB
MATIAQPRPTSPPTTGVRSPQFRTPLFLAGLGLALFAFLAMFTFGLIFASRSGSGAQITAVVAAEPISAREPITPDMLATVHVPATAALPGTFPAISALRGYYAVVDIPKGQAITQNIVSTDLGSLTLGASPQINIPQGYIIVTIPASEQQDVGGYVAQGDYIDIIVTLDKSALQKGQAGSVTKTVFTTVYVVRIGPQTAVQRQGQPQGIASSLTVLMPECDAEYMTWFVVNATVKYTLLSSKDNPPSLPTTAPACSSTVVPDGTVGAKAVEQRFRFLEG